MIVLNVFEALNHSNVIQIITPLGASGLRRGDPRWSGPRVDLQPHRRGPRNPSAVRAAEAADIHVG